MTKMHNDSVLMQFQRIQNSPKTVNEVKTLGAKERYQVQATDSLIEPILTPLDEFEDPAENYNPKFCFISYF
jgi:hypothetical protein